MRSNHFWGQFCISEMWPQYIARHQPIGNAQLAQGYAYSLGRAAGTSTKARAPSGGTG